MTFKSLLIAALATTGIVLTLYLSSQQSPLKLSLSGYLAYARKYKKLIGSPQELEYRARIFDENMIFADKVNNSQSSFTAGENRFADLSFSEFSESYLSKNPIPHTPSKITKGLKLQGSKDWRAEKKIGPVKNQKDCPSSWAFSAISALEAAYAIKSEQLLELSEQELIDCSYSYDNNGCQGGLIDNAFNYIIDNKINLSVDYPFANREQRCKIKRKKPRYSMTEKVSINPVDVSGLMKLVDQQPVAVAMEIQRDFQFYTGGVYQNSNCGDSLNFALTVVGYLSDKNNQYFILRSCWGALWGESGYARMQIGEGSGTCGIANDLDYAPKI